MEAFAHRIPPPKAKRGDEFIEPRSLLGEELIVIVTSSPPSLLIKDQPSSMKPLIASLKPL